ncbi:hypothetical protein [Streptomyces antimicrobicus]|uniref:Transcriptional regulator n=1 Tax=Streptomyces antimicrobicus TaxID=2883108 RepID=A0ABS8BAM5_9ACTN|nr:hypothetical protein [Streptomyces antimicrobicus]MCB5181665.1 hypothetical protein [Streptomyces antimicrobicus]
MRPTRTDGPAARPGRRGPGRPLLDRALTAAAARAAAPGGLRFTERQLYYETRRVLSPAVPLRLAAFTRALDARGRENVPGLLPPARPLSPTPTPTPAPMPTSTTAPAPPPSAEADPGAGPGAGPEPDLYDYGVPRVLLCQDRDTAAMLLANHVHLEAACPVLAAPDALPLDPRLLAALGRTPDATVHVLHDASPAGVLLPARVRAALPGDGPARVRVSSLGLVPRHAAALGLPSGRGPAPAAGAEAGWPAGLLPREVAWLARGRFAELAAVSPARLLRTVLRQTRGGRPVRGALRPGLREMRDSGFLTWPAV